MNLEDGDAVVVAEAGDREDVVDRDAARPAKASGISSDEIGISVLWPW